MIGLHFSRNKHFFQKKKDDNFDQRQQQKEELENDEILAQNALMLRRDSVQSNLIPIKNVLSEFFL